jgi:hypothetical protein
LHPIGAFILDHSGKSISKILQKYKIGLFVTARKDECKIEENEKIVKGILGLILG